MKCHDVRAQIGEGDFEGRFPTEIEAHLDRCGRCRRYAQDLRDTDALLLRAARTPTEAPEMPRILGRLHADLAGSGANGSRPAPSSSLWKFRRTGKETAMQTEAPQIESHPAPLRRKTRRANWRWAMGLTLAVLLGGGAGYLATQKSAERHSAQGGAPQADMNRAQYVAKNVISINNLRQLGLAVFNYYAAHDERLPPMDDPETVKQALLPYVEGNQDLFYSPFTGRPYAVNHWAGRQAVAAIESPAELVIFYEAEPDDEGNRRVVYLDGHTRGMKEEKWQEEKTKSNIP